MNRHHLTIGVITLLLGAIAGGVCGYKMGSRSDPEAREEGKNDDVAVSSEHLPHQVKIVEVKERTESMDEAFRATTIPMVDMEDSSLMELISLLQCRSAETSPQSGGIHFAIGHPLIHSPDLHDTRFTYQAEGMSALDVLDALTEQTGITYSIRPCAVLWGKNVDSADVDELLPDDPSILPRENGLILQIDLRSDPQLLIDGVAFDEGQLSAILNITRPVLENVNLILPKNRDSEMMTRVLRSLRMAQVKTVFLDTPPETTEDAEQDVEPDAFLPPE